MISLLSKGPSRVFSSTTLGKQRVYCFSINVLCDLAYLHRCSCPGEGNGNSLQHSHLENPTYRGAWRATVHRVAESRTRVSDSHTHRHTHTRMQPKGSPGCGGFTLGAPLTCPGGLPDRLGTWRCSAPVGLSSSAHTGPPEQRHPRLQQGFSLTPWVSLLGRAHWPPGELAAPQGKAGGKSPCLPI